MYKLCHTPEGAERQKNIEQTLLQLMQSGNYERISVSTLCREAKVSRQTFYTYYETKQDVLWAAIDRRLPELQDSMLFPDPRERMAAIEKTCVFFQREREFILALDNCGMLSMLIEKLLRSGADRCWAGDTFQKHKFFAMQFDVTGQFYLILGWLRRGSETPAEMAQLIAPARLGYAGD